MLQTVAIGAVIVAVGGWALYTQTDLFRPAPVVQAADTPLAVEAEAEDPAAAVQEDASDDTDVAPTQDEAEVTEPAGDDTADVDADETDSEPVIEEASATAEDPVVEEEVVIPAPTFDVVRVESDGTIVVAGTGPAGWMISILVDDALAGTVEADNTGQFVAFLDLGVSDQARVMTLSAKNGDQTILSTAQILIAPVVQVAEAPVVPEVGATPEPEAEASDKETVAAEMAPTETDATESEVALADTAAQDEAVDKMVSKDAEAAQEAAETASDIVEQADTAEVDEPVVAEDAPATNQEAAPETEVAEAASDMVDEAEVAETSGDEADTSSATVETDEAESETTQVAQAETEMVEEQAEPAQESDVADVESDEPASEESVAEDSEATPVAEADTSLAERSAPAVVLVEDDSVTVLQPANVSPEVLDELSISAISYSESGAVQLSGFSPAGFLRVYLNNVQIAVLEVPQAGSWSAELADVAPGVYTLRVDQVDADGNVQQRVETPFQREEPEKVVAAAQTRRPLVTSKVVQPGSTLWAISRENYGSGVLFVRIFEANKDQIRDPDLIYPGQIFDLPAPPGARKTR